MQIYVFDSELQNYTATCTTATAGQTLSVLGFDGSITCVDPANADVSSLLLLLLCTADSGVVGAVVWVGAIVPFAHQHECGIWHNRSDTVLNTTLQYFYH